MVAADFVALLPLLVMALASVGVLLLIAFRRDHRMTAVATVIGHALALATLPLASGAVPRQITPLVMMDRYALFYLGLILAGSTIVTVLSYAYLERPEGQREEFQREEYYALVLLATLGAGTLAAARHFASFFLGLELLSVSLYGLIAYVRTGHRALEAGIKYLILSAASSAFLLFGMALIYFQRGTMEFAGIALSMAAERFPLGFLGGLALILTAVGFKLAVVPFHMWAPDVYEGAPAPITAYIATVSKSAVVALILRYLLQVDGLNYPAIWVALSLIAAASMFVGNLLALLQNNVKRLLAYSSIAHFGYIVVAVLAIAPLAVEAVSYYLVAYVVTTLGAFGVVTVLSRAGRDADAIEEYRGLFWQRPWLATVLTVMLLSLAGIPLTAGFIAKFYVVVAAVASQLWWLVILLVVNSTIGLFYYLRLITAMAAAPHLEELADRRVVPTSRLSWAGSLVFGSLMFLLIWLGIYPAPLIRLIQTVGADLLG